MKGKNKEITISRGERYIFPVSDFIVIYTEKQHFVPGDKQDFSVLKTDC